ARALVRPGDARGPRPAHGGGGARSHRLHQHRRRDDHRWCHASLRLRGCRGRRHERRHGGDYDHLRAGSRRTGSAAEPAGTAARPAVAGRLRPESAGALQGTGSRNLDAATAPNPPGHHMISLIALLSAVLSLSGVVVGVVGVVGTTRPRGPDSAVRRAIKWLWSGHGHRRVDQWTRRTTLVVGLLAGASTWLLSGWPVAGLLVGIAVPGIPWLFLAGTAERRAIERLAAIESWTRRV